MGVEAPGGDPGRAARQRPVSVPRSQGVIPLCLPSFAVMTFRHALWAKATQGGPGCAFCGGRPRARPRSRRRRVAAATPQIGRVASSQRWPWRQIAGLTPVGCLQSGTPPMHPLALARSPAQSRPERALQIRLPAMLWAATAPAGGTAAAEAAEAAFSMVVERYLAGLGDHGGPAPVDVEEAQDAISKRATGGCREEPAPTCIAACSAVLPRRGRRSGAPSAIVGGEHGAAHDPAAVRAARGFGQPGCTICVNRRKTQK